MNKSRVLNILFFLVIIALIIPQTRTPIQIGVHKVLSLVKPVTFVDKSERITISNYSWRLQKEDGAIYNFNQTKGKVVVVNFWATWCPPCTAEMTSLDKLYMKYADSVEFLFITNDSPKTFKKFKKKKAYEFPVYNQLEKSPKELETTSIPRTLIINKNGEIVIDTYGAVDWFSNKVQKEIEALIKESI